MKYSILLFVSALALAQAPALTKTEQFQDAARKGDAAAVKKLLDEGVDVNTKFRYNATALFYACDHGHVEVVKVLLDRGADLAVKDTFYGFTPLALALGPAQKRKPEHTQIAKLLIAKGAPGKEMALTTAVQLNDPSLAQAALDSGVTPGQMTDALEAARAQNKSEMAALLEKAGAKPYQDFPIEPAQLARLAGTYKNPAGTAEIVVTVAAPRLTVATSTGQRATLVAQDAKAFKAIGMGGVMFVFDITPDAVKSFTITPMQGNPVVYTRVEGK
jgi:hypothetical protein